MSFRKYVSSLAGIDEQQACRIEPKMNTHPLPHFARAPTHLALLEYTASRDTRLKHRCPIAQFMVQTEYHVTAMPRWEVARKAPAPE